MIYPDVVGEFETIRKVRDGFSLARFGDGELKMLNGAGYSREPANDAIARELRDALTHPHRRCLPAIPTLSPDGPKYENWLRHADRFAAALSPGVRYYSAFVSRPDSAPWIGTREYAELVQSIWAGKRVAVVCERFGSMLRTARRAALCAIHVECPRAGAYAEIDRLTHEVIECEPDVAILAAGPTATCLANRLSRAGIQAVDLGSAGGFIGRLLA